ncbi:MAG: hypothetical protein AAF442_08990 [Pseudomonadota bacterium]
MSGAYFSIFIDVILLLLLVAAMVFAIILNHRLNKLSLEKEDISKTAEIFDQAVQACQEGVQTLKESVNAQTQRFAEQIKQAEKLQHDMVKITTKATKEQENLYATLQEGQKLLGHLKTITTAVPSISGTNAPGASKGKKKTTKTDPQANTIDKLDNLR